MKTRVPGGKGLVVVRQPALTGIESLNNHTSSIDYAGREANNSLFGENLVGFKQPDISVSFNYFINSQRLVTTEESTGSWSAESDSSRLKLTAGAAGAGVAVIRSRATIIYRPAQDVEGVYTAAFDNVKAGVTQEHGVYDGTDGFYISLESDGLIAVNHLRGGALVSTTKQDSFILDKLDGTGLSKFVLNPQALNVWRINYGYLGTMPASFEIYGGVEIGWVPFHYIDLTNTSNLLTVNQAYLPIRFKITSDGSNQASMYSGSWHGGAIAGDRKKNLNDQFAIDASGTIGSGVSILLSLRNESTFKSIANKIPIDIDTITVTVDGNKIHLMQIRKDAALVSPSFTQSYADSTVYFDISATGLSGGTILRSYPLDKADSLGPGTVFEPGEIRLHPGEVITFLVSTSSTTSDWALGVHWDELK